MRRSYQVTLGQDRSLPGIGEQNRQVADLPHDAVTLAA